MYLENMIFINDVLQKCHISLDFFYKFTILIYTYREKVKEKESEGKSGGADAME